MALLNENRNPNNEVGFIMLLLIILVLMLIHVMSTI
jgi:hypothetical protein